MLIVGGLVLTTGIVVEMRTLEEGIKAGPLARVGGGFDDLGVGLPPTGANVDAGIDAGTIIVPGGGLGPVLPGGGNGAGTRIIGERFEVIVAVVGVRAAVGPTKVEEGTTIGFDGLELSGELDKTASEEGTAMEFVVVGVS